MLRVSSRRALCNMVAMRDSWSAGAAALVLAVICCGIPRLACAEGSGAAGLAGRWRSAEIPASGVGALIEFRSDGTFNFSPGTAVSTPYRVEGESLVLSPAGPDSPGEKQTMVWLSDNKLVLEQKAGEAHGETVLLRSTPAPSGEPRSLIGEWTTEIKTPERTVTGRYIFRKGSTLLVLISFLTAGGIYRAEGTHIHWELPGQAPADGEFKMDGDTLTIPKPGGGFMKLKRY